MQTSCGKVPGIERRVGGLVSESRISFCIILKNGDTGSIHVLMAFQLGGWK